MPRLENHFLGPFQITFNGEPLTGFATDKVRALLAYLSVEGTRAHRREALAAMLWPNSSDSDALTSLRQALRKLRQALAGGAELHESDDPPDLLVTTQTVQIAPGEYYLDVDEFKASVKRCREHRHRKIEHCATCHARMLRAAELYRGDFLAGFLLEDSEAFDEWLVLTREGLRRQALEVFSNLMRFCEARGDHTYALHYAHRQIDMEPWREDVHRQAMELLALTGQRNAAIAQYESCRRSLFQELGVEPEAETVALYERIKASRNGSSSAEPGALPGSSLHNLPPQTSEIVGRASELREITERLDSADCRLLSLVGPGGVGKTRLALEAASKQTGAFEDGIWFASLSTANTPDLLVSGIAEVIGLSFDAGGKAPEVQLLDYLRDKEMLLVMDNFEQLLDMGLGKSSGAGLVLSILKNAPRITMLVTSRERLGLQAEYVFDLEGLRRPGGGVATAESSAVQLFVEQAQRVQRQFALSDENAKDIVDICELVVGLPLGIVLAAAWVRRFSPSRIAASIRANLDFLTSSSRDASPQHSSLRALFNHSWNLLTAAERLAFCSLSVFRGGWDEAAAADVAGASLPLLFSLTDKSLLRAASGRYDMHEVLRQYAAEQLDMLPDETNAALARHAACFLKIAEQAEEHLRGPMQAEWLDKLDRDHMNMRSAVDWSIKSRDAELGVRLAGALWRFWYMRCFYKEGQEYLSAALLNAASRNARGNMLPQAAQPDLFSTALAKVYYGAGAVARSQGDFEAAANYIEKSLDISRALDDKIGIAGALNVAGVVAHDQGDYTKALSMYDQSLAAYREAGDKLGILLELNNAGNVARELGDYASARSLLEESLAMGRELGNDFAIALALLGIGTVAWYQQDYESAASLLQQSLTLHYELGDKLSISNCLEALGRTSASQGSPGRAAQLWGAAAALREAVGSPLPPADRADYERNVEAARASAGLEVFNTAWTDGHNMALDRVISLAVGSR